MTEAPLAAALAAARERQTLASVDLASAVDHLCATVPDLVASRELVVTGWFGTSALPTLAVTLPDGARGVLKVRPPGELDVEAAVLAAGPDAYASVLLWEPRRGVLVTELCGESLSDSRPKLADQVPEVVPVLRRAWEVLRPAGSVFERKARGLVRIIDDLGPIHGGGHHESLGRAREAAQHLAATEQAEVVCHGDPHADNVLRRGAGWALVDPDGFVGERAYDVGVVLRSASDEVLGAEAAEAGAGTAFLRRACEEASALAGVDVERAWQWAFVERVTTGLYLHWFGYADEAERYLGAADVLAE